MIPKSIHDILNSQFKVDSNKFTETCLEIYRFQMQRNEVFADWVHLSLGFAKNANKIPEKLQFQHETEIPFLPISLFKSQKISCFPTHEIQFTSSSTTGMGVSQHYIHLRNDYELACLNGFDLFTGDQTYDVIAALLPSYLDRSGSGLIHMVDQLIQLRAEEGGFYNLNFDQLLSDLIQWRSQNKKVLLWGVTFGLLEFSRYLNQLLQDPMNEKYRLLLESLKLDSPTNNSELFDSNFSNSTIHLDESNDNFQPNSNNTHTDISSSEELHPSSPKKWEKLFEYTHVLETGGMKGKGPELTRSEIHQILCTGLNQTSIFSEYGMTELTSQAYSLGNGIFSCPPWMKIMIQDPADFRTFLPANKTGRICVIDLMNYHSCSFIATDDLGKVFEDGTFEIVGRIDHSDIRGCNQLVFNAP